MYGFNNMSTYNFNNQYTDYADYNTNAYFNPNVAFNNFIQNPDTCPTYYDHQQIAQQYFENSNVVSYEDLQFKFNNINNQQGNNISNDLNINNAQQNPNINIQLMNTNNNLNQPQSDEYNMMIEPIDQQSQNIDINGIEDEKMQIEENINNKHKSNGNMNNYYDLLANKENLKGSNNNLKVNNDEFKSSNENKIANTQEDTLDSESQPDTRYPMQFYISPKSFKNKIAPKELQVYLARYKTNQDHKMFTPRTIDQQFDPHRVPEPPKAKRQTSQNRNKKSSQGDTFITDYFQMNKKKKE